MKTILVTGATGFCGRILCGEIAAKPRNRIIGTFLKPSKDKLPGVHLQKVDITDSKDVFGLIKQYQPDEIYHLAAQSNDRDSWKMPEITLKANSFAVVNLLEAVRSYSPKSRILIISTAQVHAKSFDGQKKMSEDSLMWPRSPYGFSKALAELMAIHYSQAFGIHAVIARSYNHLGRGQEPSYVFPDWCKQIAEIEAGKKDPEIRVGNLGVCRDFLHVLDVVRAYQILMKRGKAGEVYNVCSSQAKPLKTYAQYLQSKAKKPIRIYSDQKKIRSQDVRMVRGSSAKLRQLGWNQERSVYKALDEMLDEWRQRIN